MGVWQTYYRIVLGVGKKKLVSLFCLGVLDVLDGLMRAIGREKILLKLVFAWSLAVSMVTPSMETKTFFVLGYQKASTRDNKVVHERRVRARIHQRENNPIVGSEQRTNHPLYQVVLSLQMNVRHAARGTTCQRLHNPLFPSSSPFTHTSPSHSTHNSQSNKLTT